MKRFWYLLTTTTVVFLIAGCGKAETDPVSENKPDVVQAMSIPQEDGATKDSGE